MSSKKDNSIRSLGSRLVAMFQGDNIAKIFFLVLSIFLWLLINLSKEGFSVTLAYPVNYDLAPEGYRLVNNPPSSVEVSLKGRGFDLIKSKLKSLKPVSIPLGNVQLNDTDGYFLNTIEHKNLISSELGDDINVSGIDPARIGLKFSQIQSQKFKVHLNYQKNFSKFKSLYRNPEIRPDSITVWGTARQLASIDSIDTKMIRLKGEEDSVKMTVDLDLPQGTDLEFSHEAVSVNMIFTSLTEGSLDIPIKMRHLPPDLNVTLIPKRVKVTYQVAINDFAKIESEDFECYVDLKDLKDNPEFLPVQIKSLPELVRNFSVEPARVEYILTK